ncbi:hypothetical protein GALL_551010 [mine drainage metagenome]|uniref:Uncharacterized protein n=1 Tax=mine drainage metagenome TaxID=410659 RepID=A0A1J5NX70_9ZZZZ
MRGGGDHLQAKCRGFIDDTGQHILAEIGILIGHAERFQAFDFVEILHGGSHLIVVRCELTEFQPVIGLIHGSGGCQGEHVRHVLFELRRHVGIVHRRAAVVDRGENIVVVQQLVHGLNRTRHLVLVVLHDIFNFSSINAALGVGFVERHPNRVAVVDALNGGDTGQVGDGADHDFSVGDAAHRVGGVNRWSGNQKTAGKNGQPAPDRLELHRVVLP